MRYPTRANTITLTLPANTAVKMLPSVPFRKAFLFSPVAAGMSGVISISPRADVAASAGILNFLTGATYPTIIDDDAIGSMVSEEWWIISLNGGEVVQVTEYLYENPESCY